MMGLTRYGVREWLGGAIAAILLIAVIAAAAHLTRHNELLCLIPFILLVWLCVAAFFRDPDRTVPASPDTIVSPADGVVHDIQVLESFEYASHFKNGQARRIGIFLSVLDVHLNRAPCPLTVREVVHKTGEFHDARDTRASAENQSNSLICAAAPEIGGFPLIVKQITGAIARRIVCAVRAGETLERGQRFGMIKFGSRTELYLPGEGIEILSKVGDRVFAGTTIVARISNSCKENTG